MRDELENWSIQLDDYIQTACWTIDQSIIIAATSSGNIYQLEPEKGTILKEAAIHKDGLLASQASPTDNIICTSGQDYSVKLVNSIDFSTIANINTGNNWVEQMAWSPNGYYVAIAIGKKLVVYNKSGDLIFESDLHPSTIGAIAWNPDSTSIVTAFFGGIKIFQLENPKNPATMEWPTSIVSISWSPDGKFVCGGTQDSKMHFWPIPYVKEGDFEMSGYKGKVSLIEWSTDAEYLATNCWNELIIWKVGGKAPLNQSPLILVNHEARITAMTMSTHAPLLVTGDNSGLVNFFELKYGQQSIATCKYESQISFISWSSDSGSLLIGTKNGVLSLLDSII